MMKVVAEDMTRNCSRQDADLILESMLFVIVINNWNSLSAGCINCNTRAIVKCGMEKIGNG